jgi:hypothetical protein
LNTRAPGDSNTTITPANPSGTKGPGNAAQYGQGSVSGSQSITPAGPYISAGTNNNIIGTVPPGKTGIPQISTVIQNPTSLRVGSASVGGSVNMADNFLPATSGQGTVPTVNAAQAASAGKSLAPEHE